ncbi:hypothetical protein ACH5RR_023516 [Cinchona calisaya]|uniref:Uncharacterized protein n=1 Tax=Cinchona calisaya TaxID=153742 RepID=A0ABD2ZAX4_9GENT
MIESLAVNDQAPLLFAQSKSSPTTQENPSLGTIKTLTTPSTDNVANSLFNEPLDFALAEDGNNMVFQLDTQDVVLQMLEVIGLQGKLRLPKHVFDDHYINSDPRGIRKQF